MRRPTYRASAAALLLALTIAVPAVEAASDEEIFRDFPFNFTNPGARALGVGGAFISLADDSTAAQANPAGLVMLRRPEFFAEFNSQSYDTSEVQVTATIASPFFQGDLTASAASMPRTGVNPTFLSYVLPFKKVSLGFSRFETLNVQTRTTNSFSIVGIEAIVAIDPTSGDATIIGTQPVDFLLASEADLDARVTQYNFAAAFELGSKFSLGLTGVLGTADLDGGADNLFRDSSGGGNFPVLTLDYATRIDDTDTDFVYNVGLLWRPAGWMNIGAVYRKGLRFVLQETVLDEGVRAAEARDLYGRTFDNVLHIPDSYGVGLSFRPADPWTILIDVVRVEYSDLMDGFLSGLNRITFPETRLDFTVDDGTEMHVGVEKIFLSGTTPVALRLGAWSDPDHRIRAERATNEFVPVFPEGERVTHYTAGFGLTLKQSIQLDFAADVSDVDTTAVFSTIFRF
ncbi:MAG: hypothetical protein GTO30_08670 [Acidobacteria bacterium]|nr:hypothetical protein [Acidobacteriota bacterium]NIM61710.1 hypothetical protein [Acidobacteriota bacterium]NIO58192.1 hypothetical protein [Acidobacteriota bacterium]NIQ83757.1 hypothetical protein [Acidobacteriota bacterium]NIT09920.1 hypothetical protein [Acidobacteriota bacterium]